MSGLSGAVSISEIKQRVSVPSSCVTGRRRLWASVALDFNLTAGTAVTFQLTLAYLCPPSPDCAETLLLPL